MTWRDGDSSGNLRPQPLSPCFVLVILAYKVIRSNYSQTFNYIKLKTQSTQYQRLFSVKCEIQLSGVYSIFGAGERRKRDQLGKIFSDPSLKYLQFVIQQKSCQSSQRIETQRHIFVYMPQIHDVEIWCWGKIKCSRKDFVVPSLSLSTEKD